MEKISLELVVVIASALVSGLYVCLLMIWTKMDQVWRAINKIQIEYMHKDACAEKRKECPCLAEIHHFKQDLSRVEKELKDDIGDVKDEVLEIREHLE